MCRCLEEKFLSSFTESTSHWLTAAAYNLLRDTKICFGFFFQIEIFSFINVFLPSKSFPFSFNSFWCTFDDVTINANPLLLLVLSIKGKLTKQFCLRIYIDFKIKEFVKVLFNTIIVQISKKWLLLFWNVPVCTFNVQFLSWILFAIPWSEFTEWEFSLFLSGKFSQVCFLW